MMNCECRPSCNRTAIVISIILGIVAGILRATAIITVTTTFLWVVFGVATAFLGLSFYVYTRNSAVSEIKRCSCSILPVLLVSILLAVLFAIILLSVALSATSIIGSILTGIMILFFSLMFLSVANLVLCKAGCKNCD